MKYCDQILTKSVVSSDFFFSNVFHSSVDRSNSAFFGPATRDIWTSSCLRILKSVFVEQNLDHICDWSRRLLYTISHKFKSACVWLGLYYVAFGLEFYLLSLIIWPETFQLQLYERKHIHVAGRNFGYQLALSVRSFFTPSQTSGTWAPRQRETDE